MFIDMRLAEGPLRMQGWEQRHAGIRKLRNLFINPAEFRRPELLSSPRSGLIPVERGANIDAGWADFSVDESSGLGSEAPVGPEHNASPFLAACYGCPSSI